MNNIKSNIKLRSRREHPIAYDTTRQSVFNVIRQAHGLHATRGSYSGILGMMNGTRWFLVTVPRVVVRGCILRPVGVRIRCLWAKCCKHTSVWLWRAQRRRLGKPNRSSLNQSLVQAACRGEEHNVEILLQRGADADQIFDRMMPLLPLLVHHRQSEIVRLLLKAGANPEARRWASGETALIGAVRHNDVAMARLLLEHGSRVDVRGYIGLTPLMYAACFGYGESAGLLLEAGADLDLRCADRNAEDYAALYGHSEILALCEGHRNLTAVESAKTPSWFRSGLWPTLMCALSIWSYGHYSEDPSRWGYLVLSGITISQAWSRIVDISQRRKQIRKKTE